MKKTEHHQYIPFEEDSTMMALKRKKTREIAAPAALLLLVLAFMMATIGCGGGGGSSGSPTVLEGLWESAGGKADFKDDSFIMTISIGGVDMDVKGTFSLSEPDHIVLIINQLSTNGGATWKSFTLNAYIDAMVMATTPGLTEAAWNLLTDEIKQEMRDVFMLTLGDDFDIDEMKTLSGTYEINDEEYTLTLILDGEELVYYKEGHAPAGTNRGSADELTANEWKDGAITGSASEVWYSFPVVSGTTYYLWWNEADSFSGTGDGSKTLDVRVTGYYGNDENYIPGFNIVDSAWASAKSLAATQTGTVYLKVTPYTSGRTGTFGIVYSTTNTRPGVPRPASTEITEDIWENGSITAAGGMQWYTFPVTSGTTYYVWWNETGFYGDGSKTANVRVTGYYDENDTSITGFNNQDTAWTTPISFTPAENHTVYLKVAPSATGNTGTFGIVYSTANARPWAEPESSTPLTINKWEDGTIDADNRVVWYTFPVTSGTEYFVWWNEASPNGDGSKTLNIDVTGYYEGNITPITGFSSTATAWATPKSFTADEDGTVYLKAAPYTSSQNGTFGIAYNDTDVRPLIQLTTAPAAPTAPTAATHLLGGINVSWNGVLGAEEYLVYRTTASAAGDYEQIGTTNWDDLRYYDDTATDFETNYFYQIAAKNDIGTGDKSPASASTKGMAHQTIIPLTDEDTWTSGNITLASSREQWFSFTATADTQYIHVNFGTLSDLYVQLYNPDLTAADSVRTNLIYNTRYATRTVTVGQEYYIRVLTTYNNLVGTYQIAFNDSAVAPFVQLTTVPPVPSTPTTAEWPPTGGIIVSWDFVIGAEEYIVYRATGSSFNTYTQIDTVTDRLTTNYLDTSATSTTTDYYYKVAAKNSIGESDQSYNSQSRTGVATATVTDLTEGAWANGEIAVSRGEQWFSFTATVSGTQYIHVAFDTLPDMNVQVYDANGTVVGSNYTSLSDSIRYASRTVTSGQTYYIRAYNSWTDTGTYQIAFNTSSTAPTVP